MPTLARSDIHLYVDGISTSVARVNPGEVKSLAVTSKQRVPAVPHIPTVAEAGFLELGVCAAEGVEAKRAKNEDSVVIPASP